MMNYSANKCIECTVKQWELLKKYTKEQISNFTPAQFRDVIKASGWVLHENIDGRTISLVPRYLHDVASNGISHYGGYALMKNLKAFFGKSNSSS